MNNKDYISQLTKMIILENKLMLERGGPISNIAKEGKLAASEIESIFKVMGRDAKISELLKKVNVKNADDLLKLIKNDFETIDVLSKKVGKAAPFEARQLRGAFELNILKSSTTSKKLLDIAAENLVKDARFIDKYKQFGREADLVQELKKAGYSDQGANAIAKKRTEIRGGGPRPPKPDPNIPPPDPSWYDPFIIWIRKGINWKKLLAWGAGIGIPAYFLWQYAVNSGESDKIEDFPPVPPDEAWPDCIMDIINSGEAKLVKAANGGERIIYSGTEYPGGVTFFSNGRVLNNTTRKMGTYTCKSGTVRGLIRPNDSDRMPQGVTESKKLSLLNILFEATTSNEVDLGTMSRFVDDAVDDLDGYVATYNLRSLKNILTQLSGKTYKGRNAIAAFLEFYKQDEAGDDFISDVQSVGVRTLGVEGMELKQEILRLAQGASAATTRTTTTTGDKIGLTNINITWDSSSGGGGGGGGGGGDTRPSIYHDCSNKNDNFEYGCISPMIAEIQACKGITPAKGYFGPKTKRTLGVNVITKALYDEIMRVCKTGEQNTSNVNTTTNDQSIINQIKNSYTPKFRGADLSKFSYLNQNEPQTIPQLSGEQLFSSKKSEFRGNLGDRKLVYVGKDLSDEERTKLNQYLGNNGYKYRRMRNKRNPNEKDVWIKK